MEGKPDCQFPLWNYFFPTTVTGVRKGELWSQMIRKNSLYFGKKGRVFSFKLKRRQVQCGPTPWPLHGVRAHDPGCTWPHEENSHQKGIEELVWHPQRDPSWIPTYKSSPSHRDEGDMLRPVFASSGAGVGVKGEGLRQWMREGSGGTKGSRWKLL